jgi:hypothetical protein
MTAISPIFAAIAIYSLFTPWVSGKLLVVGKTITGFDFPNVFWSVLIGCLAIIIVYIRSFITRDAVKSRGVIFALAAVTTIAAVYFLYVYSKKPSIPGVRVSLRGGLLLCFTSLVLSVIGSVVPLSILSPNRRESSSEKIGKSKPDQSQNQPEQ